MTDAMNEKESAPHRGSSVHTDAVNHPKHYNSHPSGIECIDIVEHLTFNVGNAFKYLFRRNHKDAVVENLRKSAWYVAREIQRHDVGESTPPWHASAGWTIERRKKVREDVLAVAAKEPRDISLAMLSLWKACTENGEAEDLENASWHIHQEIEHCRHLPESGSAP